MLHHYRCFCINIDASVHSLAGGVADYADLRNSNDAMIHHKGFKSYGYNAFNSSIVCASGVSGPQCGTSLSLMKRLLYTEMAYDAVWFGFESGLTWGPHNKSISGSLAPIGTVFVVVFFNYVFTLLCVCVRVCDVVFFFIKKKERIS